jgi:2-polyprenyl-3-methyl-5-hydroxy-6-metoxy-1,4-benzoquinol methylase
MTKKVLIIIEKVIRKVTVPYTRFVPRIKQDKSKWQQIAQAGEFRFHKRDTWRQSPNFMSQTRRLFRHFGFRPEEFVGKTIIDLGAGSKLRTKYFTGAKIIAIEPLAERFINEIYWCDLLDAEKVYSTPAEERIEECVNTADLVISMNVLDHCYDFEHIIENIVAYLKNGALAFLSFDNHYDSDKMHPLRLTETICGSVFTQKGLIIEHHSKGAGEILQTYGHGDYCHNYWLRKAQIGSETSV